VTAEDAFVEADLLNKSIHVHRCSTGEYSTQNRGGVKYRQESMIERILVPNAEPLGLEIKHFLECISKNCLPCVSISDGIKALRLAQEINGIVDKQSAHLIIQPEIA